MKPNILLVHGWDYTNYTGMTKETDAWNNRHEFIEALKKDYNVYKLNLPGFCSEAEPTDKSWSLNNFAKFVQDFINNRGLKIDYALGYSFGGPVLVRWKTLYNNNAKLILVSPAIIRNNAKSKSFIKTPPIIEPLRNFLRNQYVIHIVKTKEMVHGTPFLRRTYQIIARDDLTLELQKLNPSEVRIILGDNDKQISPNKLYNSLSDDFKKRVSFIKNGGHNIAVSHTEKLIDIIKRTL